MGYSLIFLPTTLFYRFLNTSHRLHVGWFQNFFLNQENIKGKKSHPIPLQKKIIAYYLLSLTPSFIPVTNKILQFDKFKYI